MTQSGDKAMTTTKTPAARITETFDIYDRQWLAIDRTPAFLIGDAASATAQINAGYTMDPPHFAEMSSLLIAEGRLSERAAEADVIRHECF